MFIDSQGWFHSVFGKLNLGIRHHPKGCMVVKGLKLSIPAILVLENPPGYAIEWAPQSTSE